MSIGTYLCNFNCFFSIIGISLQCYECIKTNSNNMTGSCQDGPISDYQVTNCTSDVTVCKYNIVWLFSCSKHNLNFWKSN